MPQPPFGRHSLRHSGCDRLSAVSIGLCHFDGVFRFISTYAFDQLDENDMPERIADKVASEVIDDKKFNQFESQDQRQQRRKREI
ncbi:MAG: hypothetical protein LBI39_02060 [Puniceicoccales bacterium]|nr:hypothetical protein [Puniceicoccales bacterium]